ncbi:hypothetical protein CU048_13780 [Beijerinckiaceae bacterium]|nr:hypothetical protein CU048_13780 [Beijerinckiaceae bacterium]
MNRLVSVREALESPAWFGAIVGGESYRVMRILLVAAFGEPLTSEEMVIFTSVTGRTVAPTEPCGELWIIAGRRSGKSLIIAIIASYLAACCDYRAVLGPGERGILPILAASTLQARTIFNYVSGIFAKVPRIGALVENQTSDTVSLKTRIDISIRPASFRTIRGISAVAIIAEECSMWLSDEFGSRNADKEILAAARPALATTSGPLLAIGSPHARRGETWKTFNRHFGPNGSPEILVANGPTRVFNPTIKQSVIDRAYEDDPAVAASEWGGQFRSDLESYVAPETVNACTARGVVIRPYEPQHVYIAHADPSGGGADSFTLCIGHKEGDAAIIDFLLEDKGGKPLDAVARCAEALKRYGLFEVSGDRYAAGFVVDGFANCGIMYDRAELTTSEYFAGLLPILNSGKVSLLDNKRLASQLCALERRTNRSGGKDTIGHPVGGGMTTLRPLLLALQCVWLGLWAIEAPWPWSGNSRPAVSMSAAYLRRLVSIALVSAVPTEISSSRPANSNTVATAEAGPLPKPHGSIEATDTRQAIRATNWI